MTNTRRDFLRLTGIGGVVFASGLAGCAGRQAARSSAARAGDEAAPAARDFFFLQLSDTHWGYKGDANPQADTTLKTTVATINAMAEKPDFIMFTGDLTHTTDDGAERRRRMAEMKSIVSELRAPLRFLAGEHDASLDRGAAYQEHFGDLHYTFDHEGVHFIALDNVSDPDSVLGSEQLAWLAEDLARLDRDTPIVVFAHRPLFDLYPEWDWHTRDGAEAMKQLSAFPHVTVFYGHIHQENHHMTGQIAHHSARSLIFPLPAPGSVPKKAPVPWDPAHPGQGLGWRRIAARPRTYQYAIEEHPLAGAVKNRASQADRPGEKGGLDRG